MQCRLLSALIAGAALAPVQAAAQQIASADDIIVVGRADRPITVEPRGLAVSLGEKEFEAVNAFNVEDLMKYAPNFFVRKRYVGDANGVPGFRGTHSAQSARSLVMVDGFVVSNFLGNSFGFPPKWGVVGPGDVRQFDIVYGPYSARYSGHSMGGVVSITTKQPERNEAFATVQAFSQPFAQYAAKDIYNGYTAEFGGTWRAAESPLGVSASYRRLDNVSQPMTFNFLTYQGVSQASGAATAVTGAVVDPLNVDASGHVIPVFGAAGVDHTLQDQLRVRADYEIGAWSAEAMAFYWRTLSEKDPPQTYLTTASGAPFWETAGFGAASRVLFDGAYYTASGLTFSEGEKREYLAGLKLSGPVAGWDTRLNVSRYAIAAQKDRTSNNYATGVASGAGSVTRQNGVGWYTADALFEREIGAHKPALGASFSRYETDQDTRTTTNWRTEAAPAFSTRTYGKSELAGVFIEDEIAIGSGASLTPGLRYEAWRAFGGGIARLVAGAPAFQNYNGREDHALSPKLSVQWDAGDDWRAQISLAQATRFPTVGELFQGKLDSAGQFDPQSFDPNLKPERSRDANLIMRRDFGAVRFTGSAFYQRVEDAIFSFSGLNQNNVLVSNFKNIDLVRQRGLEAIAEASDVLIDGLDIDFNVAYTDAKTAKNPSDPLSEGKQFPRIPLWRANINTRYRVSDAVSLSLGGRFASRPNTDLDGLLRGDTYSFTSEYLIFDARVNWNPTARARVSAGVDNLNNDKAFVFHPYPQRTFVVELGYKL